MEKIVSTVNINDDAETKLCLRLIAQYVHVYVEAQANDFIWGSARFDNLLAYFGLENWCAMPAEANRKETASNIAAAATAAISSPPPPPPSPAYTHSVMFPFYVQNIAKSLTLYCRYIRYTIIFYFYSHCIRGGCVRQMPVRPFVICHWSIMSKINNYRTCCVCQTVNEQQLIVKYFGANDGGLYRQYKRRQIDCRRYSMAFDLIASRKAKSNVDEWQVEEIDRRKTSLVIVVRFNITSV